MGHLSSWHFQMCDGRSFASSLFRRLAGRGAFFRGFPVRWVLHFALSLSPCFTLHDATSCPREDPLYECGRPCDTMSSLFFSALLLQRNQSVLVQEIQPAKDIDLTCINTLPTKAIKCSPMGHIFFEWPAALPPDSNEHHPENSLPALPHSRWRRDVLQPPQVQHDTAGRDTCGHFPGGRLRSVTWSIWGLVGSVLSSQD